MGAASRDFGDVSVYCCGNPTRKVVAFTATKTPGIERRSHQPRIADLLLILGKTAVTVRHLIPYETLADSIGQRFSCREDFDRHDTTKQTIDCTPRGLSLAVFPIDLRAAARLEKPYGRVGYELQELGHPMLVDLLGEGFT